MKVQFDIFEIEKVAQRSANGAQWPIFWRTIGNVGLKYVNYNHNVKGASLILKLWHTHPGLRKVQVAVVSEESKTECNVN